MFKLEPTPEQSPKPADFVHNPELIFKHEYHSPPMELATGVSSISFVNKFMELYDGEVVTLSHIQSPNIAESKEDEKCILIVRTPKSLKRLMAILMEISDWHKYQCPNDKLPRVEDLGTGIDLSE